MGNEKGGGIEYISDIWDHGKTFCQSVGDPFCGFHQCIGEDHPWRWIVCVMLPYVHSGNFTATLNTACRWSKRSAKKKYWPLPRLLLLRRSPSYWRIEEIIKWCQGKDTLNEKQSLLCRRWCHGPMFFLQSISALLPSLDVSS